MFVIYHLKIPNIEVKELYKHTVQNWLLGPESDLAAIPFTQALLDGDVAAFQQELDKMLQQVASVHDQGSLDVSHIRPAALRANMLQGIEC